MKLVPPLSPEALRLLLQPEDHVALDWLDQHGHEGLAADLRVLLASSPPMKFPWMRKKVWPEVDRKSVQSQIPTATESPPCVTGALVGRYMVELQKQLAEVDGLGRVCHPEGAALLARLLRVWFDYPRTPWLLEHDVWEDIFQAGSPPITMDEVARIVHQDFQPQEDAVYNEADCHAVFQTHEGRWVYVFASCDTTGWGCQDAASWDTANTWEELLPLLTDEARSRFGLESELQGPGAQPSLSELLPLPDGPSLRDRVLALRPVQTTDAEVWDPAVVSSRRLSIPELWLQLMAESEPNVPRFVVEGRAMAGEVHTLENGSWDMALQLMVSRSALSRLTGRLMDESASWYVRLADGYAGAAWRPCQLRSWAELAGETSLPTTVQLGVLVNLDPSAPGAELAPSSVDVVLQRLVEEGIQEKLEPQMSQSLWDPSVTLQEEPPLSLVPSVSDGDRLLEWSARVPFRLRAPDLLEGQDPHDDGADGFFPVPTVYTGMAERPRIRQIFEYQGRAVFEVQLQWDCLQNVVLEILRTINLSSQKDQPKGWRLELVDLDGKVLPELARLQIDHGNYLLRQANYGPAPDNRWQRFVMTFHAMQRPAETTPRSPDTTAPTTGEGT